MSTVTLESCIEQIGETAGLVWKLLDDEGSLPLTKLVKRVDGSRDQIMQAIGWLAREGKVLIEEEGRKRIVSLREDIDS